MGASGKFSNYCTNCTVQADRLLTCFCSPLVSRGQGSVRSTINLGMYSYHIRLLPSSRLDDDQAASC